jgi:2-methylisocitrate lyase-like PEP mutase family enzyme
VKNPAASKIFHALHSEGLLILPNAWDAASAAVIAHAGAKAIATSSAAVAWVHGYPDGQAIPPEVLLATVRAIARVVRVPVSADIEAAYAAEPAAAAAFAERVIDAGAVGVNIEDGDGEPSVLAAKISALKETGARVGVDLWVNARTDVYLRKLVQGEPAGFDETVRRARLYREAGADSIFVPAAVEESLIDKLVRAVGLPLNLLAWPSLPAGEKLRALGVRRLSAGSGLGKASLAATHELAKAFLADGRSDPFGGGPLVDVNLNNLMKG